MTDIFSKQKRSEVMSRIRGRGNRDTELALAKLLRANGITGWRRHVLIRATVESSWLSVESRKRGRNPQPSTINPQLAVRPDFVFRKSRTAIFVDGCFWHGCPKHCKYAKWLTRSVTAGNPASPKNGLRRTGRAFWRRKLVGNKTRDRVVNRVLRRAGWRVLRIWEHELQKTKKHSTPHLASAHPLPGRGGEGESSKVVQRIQRALA
jgi:DNA mismatch endonuclease (patch repair protein)